MTWVAWRQFRLQALTGFGVLAALAVLMLVTGLHVRDVYEANGLAKCGGGGGCAPGALEHFGNTDKVLRVLLGDGLIVAPALVGMFWGAPLIARELESGTFRLAWTQSVTRTRWLAAKVLMVGCAAILVCELYSVMLTWWAHPIDHLDMNRFEPGIFDERGIVAIGYGAFAFAVGLLAGAITRRTMLAIAITLLAFIGVRLTVTLVVREHLMSPAHTSHGLSAGAGLGLIGSPAGVVPEVVTPPIPNAWALSAQIVGKDGRAVPERTLHEFVGSRCPGAAEAPTPQGTGSHIPAPAEGLERCAARLSTRYHESVAYEPADRYWIFQGLETAIFVGLALLLTAACFWWIGRDVAGSRRHRAIALGRRRGMLEATQANAA
jgi:hypothetical protein